MTEKPNELQRDVLRTLHNAGSFGKSENDSCRGALCCFSSEVYEGHEKVISGKPFGLTCHFFLTHTVCREKLRSCVQSQRNRENGTFVKVFVDFFDQGVLQ
jgi:hypothetical protein